MVGVEGHGPPPPPPPPVGADAAGPVKSKYIFCKSVELMVKRKQSDQLININIKIKRRKRRTRGKIHWPQTCLS